MSHHVLLLGGHGKIAQLLTPLLLARSWTVTSIIRTQDQVPTIQKLAEKHPGSGRLNVLVRSIEDVKSEAQARAIIDEAGPDYVVWSAGAAGKGGPERTMAIDRDAATYFIHAAAATPSVTRFLLISYIAARRAPPSWWNSAAWESVQATNRGMLATYYSAKMPADEALYRAGRAGGFAAVDLRPGTLTERPAGRVELGRTRDSRGRVSREAVAQVVDALLAKEELKSAWLDLLDGDEEVGEAVERVVREEVDAVEGEPVTSEGPVS